MKLLYLCSDMGIRPEGTKGASIHVRAITRALVECGHTVKALTPHGFNTADGLVEDVLHGASCPSLKIARKMRGWLKDRSLATTVAGELRALLFNEWASSHATDSVLSFRPDAIIERLTLLSHVGLDLSERLDCPLVVEVNALLSREAAQFRGLALKELAEEIERRVFSRADEIITVSSALGDQLVAEGVSASKISVVPNGVDLSAFGDMDGDSVRRDLALGERFVVGFLGSLKAWHGVDMLMSTFARLREANRDSSLLIVGTGPMEEALKRQATELNISDAVRFAGAVEHREVPNYLDAMDVAVAPYRNMENFYFSPIKLFEYMAAGRCVVAARCGQIETVLDGGRHGLLFEAGNESSLLDCLLEAYQNSDRRCELGQSARACVEARYTWRAAAEATLRAVDSALNRRGVRIENEGVAVS